MLVAVAEVAFDEVPVDRMPAVEAELRRHSGELPAVIEAIEEGRTLEPEHVAAIVELARGVT